MTYNNENFENLARGSSYLSSKSYLDTEDKKRGNFIVRQELKSYTPECNAKCGMLFNTCLIAIFLIVGIPIIILSNGIIAHEIPYTDCSIIRNGTEATKSVCNIYLTINETMLAPVLLYYKLENFHLNHRNLVKSKIYSQLRGETHIDSSNNSRCDGAKFMFEMFDNDTTKYQTYWGKPLRWDDYANPCGLVAKSLFNDTYKISGSNLNLTINETGIANNYEVTNFFKKHENYTDYQWMDVENEHFIVWMSMETYSTFQKLWGRIDQDLPPDTYKIEITENYNTSRFNAHKSIILTTTSPIGTASFYGYLLVIFAGYCSIVVFILWILHVTNKDKKFDYNMMKWK